MEIQRQSENSGLEKKSVFRKIANHISRNRNSYIGAVTGAILGVGACYALGPEVSNYTLTREEIPAIAYAGNALLGATAGAITGPAFVFIGRAMIWRK